MYKINWIKNWNIDVTKLNNILVPLLDIAYDLVK